MQSDRKFLNTSKDVSYFYAAHNLLARFNIAIPLSLVAVVFPIISVLALTRIYTHA